MNVRGAATTEKLVVMLGVTALLIGASALFGDVLTSKFAVVIEALGGPAADSLAARESRSSDSNGFWVLVFVLVSLGFSIFFLGPLLLPKLRLKRQVAINSVADKVPVMEVFADRSQEFQVQMQELRGLAREVQAAAASNDPDATMNPSRVTAPVKLRAESLNPVLPLVSADDSATINREAIPRGESGVKILPTLKPFAADDDIPTVARNEDSSIFSSVPLTEFRKEDDEDVRETTVRRKLTPKSPKP